MFKREDIHIRDPFVFTENKRYYLLGTTGDDPWGKASDLTLYVSDDLESFERKCVMVTDNSLDSYTNVWAPEMHKYKGKYYLIVSLFREDLGRGSIIFVSDGLDDKFKMLTGKYVTPEGWGCLDATLFVYKGKPYLCFSNEWTTPISNDGDGSLFIAELKDDLTEICGEPKKIVSGKDNDIAIEVAVFGHRGYIAEGPWLYEEDGKVVLLWSTLSKTGYTVVKSVSNNGVLGEYRFEKIIFDKDGGHCMRFIDFNGNAEITLHQPNSTPDERMKIFNI